MPSILGLLGMTLIGTVQSLAGVPHHDRTCIRGSSRNGKGRPAPAAASQASAAMRPQAGHPVLLEARVPGLSEPVSAIAVGGLRSLMRSPEAKMMLLTPVIMIPIFGSMLWRGRHEIPEPCGRLIAIGGMVLVLFGLLQLMGNQFGFRPRRLSRVRALFGRPAGHSAGQEPGVRPAGSGHGVRSCL